MSDIKIDETKLECLKHQIHLAERNNYKTKNKNDKQMLDEIKKILESVVLKDDN